MGGARILSWPIRRAPFPSTEGVRGEGSPRVFFVHPPLADLVGWKIIYFWHVIIIHWLRSGYELGKSASRFTLSVVFTCLHPFSRRGHFAVRAYRMSERCHYPRIAKKRKRRKKRKKEKKKKKKKKKK